MIKSTKFPHSVLFCTMSHQSNIFFAKSRHTLFKFLVHCPVIKCPIIAQANGGSQNYCKIYLDFTSWCDISNINQMSKENGPSNDTSPLPGRNRRVLVVGTQSGNSVSHIIFPERSTKFRWEIRFTA